jgi:hypothetical protein
MSANRDRRKEDAERKILATMPMAGADAELAGEHSLSETVKELRDTAGHKPAQQIATLGWRHGGASLGDWPGELRRVWEITSAQAPTPTASRFAHL